MDEQLTVSQDFLRRALGSGEGGDPQTVGIFPGTLPNDFPLTLPEGPGLRVLGSVRGVETGWTFRYPQGAEDRRPERRLWRAFLDVASPLTETMSHFQAALRAQGWQTASAFAQAFVEAEQSQWLAVHPAHVRSLVLHLRAAEPNTQVWLRVKDSEPEQIAAQLGRFAPPGHLEPGYFGAPLPTLTLPLGWRVRPGQGQDGSIRSQEYELLPPNGAAESGLLSPLLAHLQPQLGDQGWQVTYQEGELSVYRTAQGIGTLTLNHHEAGVGVQIVHITSGSSGQAVSS